MNKQADQDNKVVFLAYNAGRGGASRVMSIVMNELSNNGWKVTYVVRDIFQSYELNPNIEIIELGKNKKFSKLYYIKWLHRYIRENDIKHVISFLLIPNVINILACAGTKAKPIISERNDPTKYSIKYKILARMFYGSAYKIVFQTQAAQNYYPRYISKKGTIISNPVSVKVQASKTPKKKIVFVGRLEKQKNLEMLIEAFKEFVSVYKEYALFVYGDGSRREIIENQIRENGLSDKIYLKGNVFNVHEEIADAMMFVIPSDFEGMSNSLLEAIQIGLPVISTKTLGSDTLVSHNENGLLINIGDKEGLLQAMETIAGDMELRNRMAEKSYALGKNYRTERIMEKWVSIISQ